MKHKVKRVHFVGIGGAGMSGIAEVLATQGYAVTGSDLHESAATKRLRSLGVKVSVGHDAANVQDGPVCTLRLPERVSSGTHATWAAGSSLPGWATAEDPAHAVGL